MKGKLSFMWRATLALVLVLSLGVVMAAPVSAAGALVVPDLVPANDMAGETTTYPIVFTTGTAGDIASVDMTFAAGFDVSGAAFVSKSGTISAGTVSVSGQVVTYTVTTPATIGTGVDITITLSDIVNPSAGTYLQAVTITTKNLAGGAIDIGSGKVIITAAPVSFEVVAPTGAGNVTVGTPFTVTVTALESDGTTTEDQFDGTYLIDFTSTATDPKTIPAFEVVTFNSGVGTTSTSFVLNVVETGKTITATYSELGVTGTSDAITFIAASLDRLVITGAPTTAVAGVAFSGDVTVTAVDAYGNVIIGYTQEVTWAVVLTDADKSLPAAYTFVTGDAGVHTFSGSEFILKKAGSQTITVSDPGTVSPGTASITVNAAAASKLDVAAVPTTIDANGYDSSVITATVLDEFDNTVITSTAAITFETSVGGFTQASGASTYVKAALLGVATPATLTSTDSGKATVKVTSGSLTYATTPVTLTLDAAPTEIWVDDDYSSDAIDGGHDWQVDAFATIQDGIDDVAAGGTVNVAAGAYAEDISISKPLTLSGPNAAISPNTGTRLTEAIIDGQISVSGATDDVTIQGFHFDVTPNVASINCPGGFDGDDLSILSNSFTADPATDINWEVIGVHSNTAVAGLVIDDNLVTGVRGIFVNPQVAGSDVTITDNVIDGDSVTPAFAGISVDGVSGIISGNVISYTKDAGINVGSAVGACDSLTISNNTVTYAGRALWGDAGAINLYSDCTDITITGNTLADSYDGITIKDWLSGALGSGIAVNNNNITGNSHFGVVNSAASGTLDAENNWWGDDSGPYVVTTNTAGTGDEVTTLTVDYRPWLTAPYAMPADPVTSDTISLVTGWNLISLPIIPTSPVIATVLADLITAETVDQVRIYEQGDWSNWASTEPHGTLTIMKDGSGYWIDMNAADTLVIAGSELPVPPATPPSYSVYTGWNMIGFKSVDTNTTVAAYLGTMVAGTLEAIYGYDAAASAYFIPGVTTGHLKLEPGCGYWLAVNAAGTIYP